MRRALVLLAALAVGAAPLTAHATTAPALTLTQQARKADVIVRATLGTPTTVTEGEATWLAYPLTVTEAVAGDPASLPQREGRPALYLLSGLEDLPDLRAGQDTFLLLYARRLDNPIVGFAQGLYLVENGRVTRPGDAAAPASTATNPAPGTPAGSAAAPAPTGSTPTTAATGTGPTTAPAAGAPASPTGSPPGGTGTTGPTTPPAAGTTTGTPGAATTPAPAAPGTTGAGTPPSTTPPAATAPAPGTATPTPSAPGTAPAASAPSTPPAASDANAFPSDPARFRDALRAAREAR